MKIFFFRESEQKNINPDVIDESGFGATDITLVYLAQMLGKHHKVKVYCPTKERKFYDSVEYIPYKDYGGFLIENKKFDADAIIVTGNPAIITRGFVTGKKVVFWQKNHPDEMKHFPVKQALEKDMMASIVFSSDAAGEYGRSFYKDDRVIGIFNGVRDLFFEDRKMEREKGKIIYVGSFNKTKGLHQFLTAAQDTRLSEFKFEACGSFDMYGVVDQKFKDSCMPMLAYPNMKYEGRSLGALELSEKMQSAELVIVNPMVGNKETCCVSALEAMASVTPVIGGGKSLIESIVAHGGECYTSSLADAILNLMRDKEKRDKLAFQGYNWVNDNFRWETIVAQWEELFKQCGME